MYIYIKKNIYLYIYTHIHMYLVSKKRIIKIRWKLKEYEDVEVNSSTAVTFVSSIQIYINISDICTLQKLISELYSVEDVVG